MEAREFELRTEEPFSGFSSDRGFDRFESRSRSFEREEDRFSAREKLQLRNDEPPVEDNRSQARALLFAGRIPEEPQAAPEEEYAVPEFRTREVPREEEGSRLFVDDSFGSEFLSKRPSVDRGTRYYDDIALMPSNTTMQYADYAPADVRTEQQEAVVTRKPLTKKQKISVAIYSAIVVVIAALIITTGALIGAITADVQTVSGQLNEARTAYAETVNGLELTESDAYIRARAEGMGMTEGESATRLTLIPVVETEAASAPTNGFDRFCDWLSHVFG